MATYAGRIVSKTPVYRVTSTNTLPLLGLDRSIDTEVADVFVTAEEVGAIPIAINRSSGTKQAIGETVAREGGTAQQIYIAIERYGGTKQIIYNILQAFVVHVDVTL